MRKTILLLSTLLTLSMSAETSYLWRPDRMEAFRQSEEETYVKARAAVVREADKILQELPASVTDQERVASSGNKHDYFSMARYWWPNPKTENHLPYVRKDGQKNPETDGLGRTHLSRFEKQLEVLTLAYYYSGKEVYADQAMNVLRTWFINKKTYMTPHMEYSQVRLGHDNNHGSNSGLLDAYSFMTVPDALTILSGSKAYKQKDADAIRKWFAQYVAWMVSSEQGKKEDVASNNHGTAYHIQVVMYATFAGNDTLREQYIRSFAERRIMTQFEKDGRQPKELARTRGFGYSCFNLKHIFDFADICRLQGIDFFADEEVRARVLAAIDFLTPYLGRPVSAWPFQQIADWEKEQQTLCWILYRAGDYFPEKDYISLFRQYNKAKPSTRHYLY